MEFLETWLKAVHDKNSVLCAGLDPAVLGMDRPGEEIPEGVSKRDWALRYVEAVAPFAAALKPNMNYWKGPRDMDTLKEVTDLACDKGLVIIEDAKLADIGSTNDAGLFYAAARADAVTLAPYAGNMAEAAKQAQKRGIGLITMVLMSNPEYAGEKGKLMPLRAYASDLGEVTATFQQNGDDVVWVHDEPYARQFMFLAQQAKAQGLDGIVIGAPSKKNHITDEEIGKVRGYVGDKMLVLLPGVGAQGGEAGAIWKHFAPDRVIVNVGRALMFPESGDQAATAAHYQKMLNELRGAA